mmetsp:Transcript_31063/g.98620  ORF Transcript_31063/g.98620 Transcript_31063/m.98620 type:complete len:144 (-) Transcript_31063:99-530(-)
MAMKRRRPGIGSTGLGLGITLILSLKARAQPEEDDEPPPPEALDAIDIFDVISEDVIFMFVGVILLVMAIPIVRWFYYRYTVRAIEASRVALSEARSRMSGSMSSIGGSKAGSMIGSMAAGSISRLSVISGRKSQGGGGKGKM